MLKKPTPAPAMMNEMIISASSIVWIPVRTGSSWVGEASGWVKGVSLRRTLAAVLNGVPRNGDGFNLNI
jgi:hypothetical protein